MKFVSRNTLFHRLDPRTKIGMSLMCACLIVLLRTPEGLLALLSILLATFFFVRPPAAYVRTLLYLMGTAVIFTMISQGFFYYFEPKTPVFTIVPENWGWIGRVTGGLAVYREGLIYGAVQSLRLCSAMVLSMTVVMSTYPSDLILGLERIGVPEKVGFVVTVSIRFLPAIIEEAKRILTAQKLRGLKGKGVRGGFRVLRYLLPPLIIDSLRHARRIALAAAVRAYTGERTHVRTLQFSRTDWVATAISAFLTIFLLFYYGVFL
ncbi:MAG: energy-coupling factor transporter transmembrane protein EcfT [Deltaproteobacteria bacterium]|nr:energy-coupling factor transporter transmembrane protein EcfT [Deltaproteobacteria bacterium]